MRNDVRDGSRKKCGGEVPQLSLDDEASGLVKVIADAQSLTPEQLFDVAWNRVVMSRAVTLLEKNLTDQGKAAAFEAFRRYDLEGGSQTVSYTELGEALGLSAPQVKHALLNARAVPRHRHGHRAGLRGWA